MNISLFKWIKVAIHTNVIASANDAYTSVSLNSIRKLFELLLKYLSAFNHNFDQN